MYNSSQNNYNKKHLIMLIIKFRKKYIFLDNFQLGLATYIATIAIMWYLERRRKRKKRVAIANFFDNTLKVRGGGFFVRRFLRRKLKKKTMYEIVDPRLVRYIRELTRNADSTEILYIDLELVAYAVRTMHRPRSSEFPIRGIFTFINPIRTYVTIALSASGGIYMWLKYKISVVVGSIAIGCMVYSMPYSHYDGRMFSALPYNEDNVQYVLKHPEVGRIITCVETSPLKYNVYDMEGELISDKEKTNSTDVKRGPIKGTGESAVCVRHKNIKRKSQVSSLSKLEHKVTKKDYEESEKDASYVRDTKNKEPIRIRENRR